MSGERATHLSGLYVYPIKSCRGISLDAWDVDGRGLRLDRRWMLVDENGRFLSQRELPRMALIGVRIGPEHLAVDAPGMPSLEVPFGPATNDPVPTRVWNDVVMASPAIAEAGRWFSAFLGVKCALVRLSESSTRPVDPDYGGPEDQVHLADGFPFLLTSEASLADLNERLDRPLPMNRFRPNLVVEGCGPFAEDGWDVVRIGAMTFRVVKACTRCVITTVDQGTAATAREPLRTLATFRREGNKVLFGQNLIHDEDRGTLRVGDPVEVVAAPTA
jgi:uncharacterized protein